MDIEQTPTYSAKREITVQDLQNEVERLRFILEARGGELETLKTLFDDKQQRLKDVSALSLKLIDDLLRQNDEKAFLNIHLNNLRSSLKRDALPEN